MSLVESYSFRLDYLSRILSDADDCELQCPSPDWSSSFELLDLLDSMCARMVSVVQAWKRILSTMRERYKKSFCVKSVIFT